MQVKKTKVQEGMHVISLVLMPTIYSLDLSSECFFNETYLPSQGFGPEAKTRGGTLGFQACIHIRNFKM